QIVVTTTLIHCTSQRSLAPLKYRLQRGVFQNATGGNPMTSKFGLSLSTLLLLGVTGLAPAHAQRVNALLAQAVEAEGGADALRALKSISIKSEARHWEPEQSLEADGEPRFLGNSSISITWDLAKGMTRSEWTRDMKYPGVRTLKFTEVVTPTVGYVSDEK